MPLRFPVMLSRFHSVHLLHGKDNSKRFEEGRPVPVWRDRIQNGIPL